MRVDIEDAPRVCGCNTVIHMPGLSVCKLAQDECSMHSDYAPSHCRHCGHPILWHRKQLYEASDLEK